MEKERKRVGRQVKKRVKTLSGKEKRELGLNHSIQRDTKGLNFNIMRGLNRMWNEYIQQVLNLDSTSSSSSASSSSSSLSSEQRFLKSDWHGSSILCIRSRCPSFVHLSGLLLQETSELMRILTVRNEVKSVMKRGSVFQIRVGQVDENGEAEKGMEKWDRVFEVYGDQMALRSSERTVKKFKQKPNIQL